jgi:hypothetical protein
METEMRGVLEKYLDRFLSEDFLQKKVRLLKFYQSLNLVTSIEDALFGALLIGLQYSAAIYDVERQRTSDITDEETQEFSEIIRNRSLEIKTKISKASNR